MLRLHDPEASAMVRAIVGVGCELGIDVVANGVETEAQRELLSRPPSPARVQGFYYCAPVTAIEATALLRQRVVEPRLSEVSGDAPALPPPKGTRSLSGG